MKIFLNFLIIFHWQPAENHAMVTDFPIINAKLFVCVCWNTFFLIATQAVLCSKGDEFDVAVKSLVKFFERRKTFMRLFVGGTCAPTIVKCSLKINYCNLALLFHLQIVKDIANHLFFYFRWEIFMERMKKTWFT